MTEVPKVFISYSHDAEAHENSCPRLANRLRWDGVDAQIDQYEVSPPEGWPMRCERQIKQADFVLLVCTQTYLRRSKPLIPVAAWACSGKPESIT